MRLHRVTIPGHANLAASNIFTATTQKEVMSESILAEAKSIVSEHPASNASSVFLEGDPAAQILRYATKLPPTWSSWVGAAVAALWACC